MTKILSTLILLIISTNSFSQNIDYKVSSGGNYSFFTWSFYPELNNESLYLSHYNENYFSDYTYPQLIRMIEIESVGKAGFYINNNFSFTISKYLSFKTGFGFNINNVDYKTTFSTDYENVNFREDSITYINSFFLSDENTLTSFVSDYDTTSIYFLKSNFDIFSINIPFQIQVKLFNQALLVSSGISISALISAKNTPSTNKGVIRKYEAENDFEKFFINFHSDIDFQVYKNFFVTASFIRSISDIKQYNDFEIPDPYSYLGFPNSYNKLHINSISLGLSYKL